MIACTANLAAQPAAYDSNDDDPYSNPTTEPLDRSRAPLILTVKAVSKAGKIQVKAEIKLYNNTSESIIMVETTLIYIDFDFEIKDSADAIISPNAALDKYHKMWSLLPHMGEEYRPGQESTYRITLSKIYDFKSGETYSARALGFIMSKDGKRKYKITSAFVRFTVP